MMMASVKSIMQTKYNKYKVYMHNFAIAYAIDAVFLLSAIAKYGRMSPVYNDGKFIQVKLNGPASDDHLESVSVTFLDSYQMLVGALGKLGKSFKIEDQKGIFPHFFAEPEHLTYKGLVPHKSFFPATVTDQQYSDYSNNFNFDWSFREESIKYCQLDCISLFQVISKFIDMFYGSWKMNTIKYSTTSSLTYGVYKTHYVKPDTIPLITGDIREFIQVGYTGGSTDMFLPSNLDENMQAIEELYCYDVNSLYPYIMANHKMPTGKMFYFEGKNPPADKLGFYHCKVKAPLHLKHPIIQVHIDKVTMSPVGEFETVLYSEEIKNAIKFGYEFEIINGYFFDKAENIFADYINKLYNLRMEYPKSDPMNFIAKLLLNALYGKFAMSDYFDNAMVYDNKKFNEKMSKMPYREAIRSRIQEIGDSHTILFQKPDETDLRLTSLNVKSDVNIAISAAITAMARVYMSQYKNRDDIKLYYSDTDSIFINKSPEQLEQLFPDNLGWKLGQLKLEYPISRAVFLGAKSYYLETKDGNCVSNIVKIKGLNSEVANSGILTIESFYQLLKKNESQVFYQNKWIKNLGDNAINILQQSYTLRHNSNKRRLIFNTEGVMIDTVPYEAFFNVDKNKKSNFCRLSHRRG